MPLIERALMAKLRFLADPTAIFPTPPRPADVIDLAAAQKARLREVAAVVTRNRKSKT